MANEPMVVPAIEEGAEPIAEAEEEQVVSPVVDIEEEKMAAPVMDMEEDLAALFGEDGDFEDDGFSDGDFEGVVEDEVWEVNEEWLMAPVTPPPTSCTSVIEHLSTRLGNLEYEHGQLVKKVIQVSDAEMVHAADRWERVGAQAMVQQRDAQIQQLQTMFSETSSRRSTLMQCIMGLDRRLAKLERRPLRPQ
nr:hypothetical protein [Tanacetum cinerariifolium]